MVFISRRNAFPGDTMSPASSLKRAVARMSWLITSRSVSELADTEGSARPLPTSSESLISTSAVDPGLNNQPQHSTKNAKIPIIVGSVVGGVAVTCLVVAIAWFFWRRFKRARAGYEDPARWHIEGTSILNAELKPKKYGPFASSRTPLDGMTATNRPLSLRTLSTSPNLLDIPLRDSSESQSITPASSIKSLPLLQRPVYRLGAQQSTSTTDTASLL